MLRHFCSVLLLLIACVALAAPAPQDSWKQHGWERPLNPDHGCKFDINDGTVTIALPGGDHELAPKRKRFNAPRVLREVEGDFVVQVRVSASFRPSAKSSVDSEEPRVAAGLLILLTDKDYIRLDYTAYRLKEDRRVKADRLKKENRERKGDLHKRPTFQMQGSQVLEMEMEPPWNLRPDAKEEHIYLRFERQGNDFREAISPDGKAWTTNVSASRLQNLPRKFKAGLAAYSTSTEPFKVRFDQFQLTTGQNNRK